MNYIHVVGAGMAGLAAAVRLVRIGECKIAVYEAGRHAGGRCRSFHDKLLDCRIDNGNHLILSGNRSVAEYLADMEAGAGLMEARRAAYPFVDLRTGERWEVKINPGLIPWWAFSAKCRPPGVRARDIFSIIRLFGAHRRDTVAECFGSCGPLYERFIEPLSVAILNTPSDRSAAALLKPVIAETFARGGSQCRPMFCPDGLSTSLVEPALRFLAANGSGVQFSKRLRRPVIVNGRISRLEFAGESIPVAPADGVILAVPAFAISRLVPEVSAPQEHQPIVNVHYRIKDSLPKESRPSILGVIGGTAQWIFRRRDIVSVTVSAAEGLADCSAGEIAARIWGDVQRALAFDLALPECRVVKERMATFAQTPESLASRPATETAYENLFLAGDWTDTGLPATIEGAVRSGQKAAEFACSR